MRDPLLVVLALVLAFPGATATAEPPKPDMLHLTSGDRVSGKIVARGTKRIRIRTPYGLLIIPKSEVAAILHADGTEEIVSAPIARAETEAETVPKPTLLSLVVTGSTFWLAWGAKNAPQDPSLRLVLRLDERDIIGWTDGVVDEGEIKGAVVNAFSFEAGTLVLQALSEGVVAEDPATSPGRVVLRLALPPGWNGRHRVGTAYQVAEGTPEARTWRDVSWTVGSVDLGSDREAVLTLEQDQGSMEFSGFPRRRMKNVETFALGLRSE